MDFGITYPTIEWRDKSGNDKKTLLTLYSIITGLESNAPID